MDKFLYGVATSAFQIEGDDGHQGKGESIWDAFCKRENTVYLDQSPVIAADHYNRYKEDVDLMKELGVNAYRFSVSWPRIFPQGVGKINRKGLDFYKNLVDKLCSCGITPVATLYHWDLPETLSEKGGLRNPDFHKWFSEYAYTVVTTFKGLISNYITFNEPINCVNSGYVAGVFAPGEKLNALQGLKCIHHLLLAHKDAAEILHSVDDTVRVGFVTSSWDYYPATDTKENYEIAKTLFFENPRFSESVDSYMDPVYLGKYPERLLNAVQEFANYAIKDDFSSVPRFTDYIGLNIYGGHAINLNGKVLPFGAQTKISDMGTVIDEKGLYYGVKFLTERYKKPIFITETGCCCNDWLSADGKIYDRQRIDCISSYLSSVEKLRKEGYDIRGFFVWSLMDNFEWISGYSKRFGLVYLDFDTLKRIKKQSYYWFKKYIEEHKG